MIRPLLFAALLCVSAWALADRVRVCSCDRTTTLSSPAWSLSDAPIDGTGANDWWDAQHASSISLTQSGRRAQWSCTDVPRGPGHDAVHLADRTPASTRPPPYVSAHLQHIPLLI